MTGSAPGLRMTIAFSAWLGRVKVAMERVCHDIEGGCSTMLSALSRDHAPGSMHAHHQAYGADAVYGTVHA